MNSMNIDLFIKATNNIKFDVIDDRLLFSANRLYTFITQSNSMSKSVVKKYEKYICFEKINEGRLQGSKYNFTYALNYEDTIKFISKVSNAKEVNVNAVKSLLAGIMNNFMLNIE